MGGVLAENLLRKFGLEPGQHVCLVDAPPDAAAALADLAGPEIEFTDYIGLGGFDQVFWWPQQLPGLDRRLAQLAYSILPDGAVWLMIPKKNFAPGRGIQFSWDEMQALALQTDLVDNKIASFSDTDYGTRFVIRKDLRPKYR